MRLALALLFLLALSIPARAQPPALVALAGPSYAGQPPQLVPFAAGHLVRPGDTFAYDVATDWRPGDTRTLTITLDPRVAWFTLGGRDCRGDALSGVQVCAQPDAVWAWVRVRDGVTGGPLVTTFTYGTDVQTVTLALAASGQTFLPLISR